MARQQHSGNTQGTGPARARRTVLTAVFVICLVVVVCCSVYIGKELYGYHKADAEFGEIAQEYAGQPEQMQAVYADSAAWVKVDDTRIDYPVMYTPEDPEYYLHRNVEGKRSKAGTPFYGEGSLPEEGNSNIIYGHHMRDGSMFASLLNFDKKAFGTSHKVELTTVEGTKKYTTLGAFYMDLPEGGSPYEYWNNVGKLSKKRSV